MSASPGLPFVRPAAVAGRHFSTVIVGAGINGVGVFRDLSLQGVDCLIVDKGDFSAGASSAPSRMIHGGLRYLESGSFSLVAEATRERNLLLRNAPHLVQPLKTVVPLSSLFGGVMSSALKFLGRTPPQRTRGLLAVATGLRLYDLLGRRQRVMPNHRISRVQPADRLLFRAAVRWTATFFDAWISHPEWLVLELVRDACRDQPRSAAINHCRVTGCAGNTLTLRDEATGEVVQVTADAVVNASGAWLDRSTELLGGPVPRVMGTKGSHLVLDHPLLRDALGGRMAYFEALDGRVCIVYPFLDRVLVGSTDIPVDDPDQIATEPAEVEYLLEVLGEVFPNLAFGREDVVYTYVGVRPLARSNADKPGQISRDHSVVIDPPSPSRDIPVVGLVGGKWTTFRALAEEACDEVLRLLGRDRTASTRQLPIGGGAGMPRDAHATQQFIDRIARDTGLAPDRAQELLRRYGSWALHVARRFKMTDDAPLQHAPGYSAAEIAWLCTDTGVIHLDDLVIRRTLLAIRGLVTDAGLAELAGIAAQALGWDAERERQELHNCSTALRERHGVRLAPAVPDSDASPAFPASLTTHPALSPS
ncbi:glycerol-3-phosphate dehydrogenase/oxidase [Acidovorax sp. sic0104]|uniref:glycerol-3-phosphate dehydrogenase/oxidase n=1 Tax=Acidovorax sp. sic0104 TaxID=2854784 RepID=UPI001C466429|nr:glycerol-3-phosphate dehydrogenase/oxidase [Acidovorax sp. sic0104]MBV7541164.1 glycerol-3-phosphate dehydrogenase/oxidase [Acidovorax sp. sic0104]